MSARLCRCSPAGICGGTRSFEREPAEFATARTAADEPFMLIYTSGTTGKPKGAVHTHCGFPIKAAQDMQHGFDVRASDTMFWVTDLGWMMGPWELLGTTLLGASAVVYDGAMDYPSSNRLWTLIQEHRVSILGVSPTLIRMLMHARDSAIEAARSVVATDPRLDRRTMES